MLSLRGTTNIKERDKSQPWTLAVHHREWEPDRIRNTDVLERHHREVESPPVLHQAVELKRQQRRKQIRLRQGKVMEFVWCVPLGQREATRTKRSASAM